MSIPEKFFKVHIENNMFCIMETSRKPEDRDSALHTLSKIEYIVKNQLEYNYNYQDSYSKLSKEELFESLKHISSEIHKGYTRKQSNLSWLARKIFSKEKIIDQIDKRIENYVIPPQALYLPNELIQEVTKHLGVSDISAFAKLNRHGKDHAATAILKRAKELGYDGQDETQAAEYLKSLFKEVEKLSSYGIIPKKYLSYKEKTFFREKFDSENILKNLENLTNEDVFTLFANNKIYSPSFQKFRKLISSKKNWKKPSNVTSEPAKRKGSEALFLASKNNEKNVLELLLQQGADPNIRDKYKNLPIHFAAQNGSAEIVEMLIKKGTSVNELGAGNITPLAFACGAGDRRRHKPNVKVVEVLLKYGADPDIPVMGGANPLKLAKDNKLTEIVQILENHKERNP